MRTILISVCIFLLSASLANALTQPDISAVGDFRLFSGNWQNLDGTKTSRNGNLNMSFEGLELVFAGYLNPFARAWVTVGFHNEEIHVEEAYASIERGLPFRTQIRGGRMLVDFCKLNTYHVHSYPFVDRPLLHRVYLGAEGWSDVGLNASWMLPTGFYSKLSLNLLRGDIFTGTHHHEHGGIVLQEEEDGRHSEKPIYSGRLNAFLPFGEQGNIDIGISGAYGIYQGKHEELSKDLFAAMFGFDAKFKQTWSDYRSLIIQGEFIRRQSDMLSEDNVLGKTTTFGGLLFFDLKLRKRYSLGLMFETSPGIFDNGLEDYDPGPPEELNNTPVAAFDSKNRTYSGTVFGGYYLLEETTILRVFARYTSFKINDPSKLINTELTSKENEIMVGAQLVWSLGPHKPHEF